jgi:hypothetical protein
MYKKTWTKDTCNDARLKFLEISSEYLCQICLIFSACENTSKVPILKEDKWNFF